MKKFTVIFIIIAILTLTLVLVLIFSKNRYSSVLQNSAELPIITLSSPPASFTEIVFDVIIEKGFDKENGFTLNTKSIGVESSVAALFVGSVDVVKLSPLEVAKLSVESKDVKLFYYGMKLTCPLISKHNKNLNGLDDLKNKKIGLLSRTSGNFNALEVLLAKKGYKIDDYFSKITITTMPALPGLLAKGDVDAVSICNLVSLSKLETAPENVVIDSIENAYKRDYGEDKSAIFMGLAARGDWLNSNKDLALRLTKAYDQGLNYLKNNPDYYLSDIYANKFEMNEVQMTKFGELVKSYDYFNIKPWGDTIDELNNFISDAVFYKVLDTKPQESIFIDLRSE